MRGLLHPIRQLYALLIFQKKNKINPNIANIITYVLIKHLQYWCAFGVYIKYVFQKYNFLLVFSYILDYGFRSRFHSLMREFYLSVL